MWFQTVIVYVKLSNKHRVYKQVKLWKVSTQWSAGSGAGRYEYGGSLSHVAHCTARAAIPTRLTAGPVRWVSVVACNSLDSRLLDADARDTSAIYRCGPFLFSHQIVFHAQLTSSTSCSRFFLWDFLKTFPWVSHNYNLLLLRNLQKAQSEFSNTLWHWCEGNASTF